MATTRNQRHAIKRGPPSTRGRILHLQEPDGDGHRLPANLFAQMFEKEMAPIVGGGRQTGVGLTAAIGWALTVGGTGDALADDVGGGILITTPSDDDFNMCLESLLAVTPTSGKWYGMVARIQASHATQLGFRLGLGDSQALPFTNDYTDFVGISKAITSTD